MGAYVIEPRRLFRGIATSPAVAAQNSFVALYNDSNSAYYVSLIHPSVQGSAGVVLSAYGAQGAIGTLASRGVSLVQGRGPRAGALYTGSTATPGTADQIGLVVGPGTLPTNLFPLVVLPPGYYWLYFNTTVNTAVALNMLWSVDDTDDIDPLEESAVFKAAQPRA